MMGMAHKGHAQGVPQGRFWAVIALETARRRHPGHSSHDRPNSHPVASVVPLTWMKLRLFGRPTAAMPQESAVEHRHPLMQMASLGDLDAAMWLARHQNPEWWEAYE